MDRSNRVVTGLVNKSTAYTSLKEHILGVDFPWYFMEPQPDSPFPLYCHTLIDRPEFGLRLPEIKSQFAELAHDVVLETCEFNNVKVNCIYRLAINATEHMSKSGVVSTTHVDHEFYHRNLLIYFTNAGGATVVEDYRHEPEVDTFLLFSGHHYHELPEYGRRVVLVATFLD
jgi:hypothetical protein